MAEVPLPTGRLNYLKLVVTVKVMRAMFALVTPIGRWTGRAEYPETPHEVIHIPSSKSNRTIRINIHRNKAAISSTKPTAVHLNWPGSGWLLPLLGQNAGFIRTLIASPTLASYPLTILDCSYALSPEHPCPADTEDARDAYEYVLSHPEKYDASKMTCSGFSTGGTLALGLSVAVGEEAQRKAGNDKFISPLKAVITFYPSVTWLGDPIKPPSPPPGKKDWPGMIFPDPIIDIITAAHFFSPTISSPLTSEQELKN